MINLVPDHNVTSFVTLIGHPISAFVPLTETIGVFSSSIYNDSVGSSVPYIATINTTTGQITTIYGTNEEGGSFVNISGYPNPDEYGPLACVGLSTSGNDTVYAVSIPIALLDNEYAYNTEKYDQFHIYDEPILDNIYITEIKNGVGTLIHKVPLTLDALHLTNAESPYNTPIHIEDFKYIGNNTHLIKIFVQGSVNEYIYYQLKEPVSNYEGCAASPELVDSLQKQINVVSSVNQYGKVITIGHLPETPTIWESDTTTFYMEYDSKDFYHPSNFYSLDNNRFMLLTYAELADASDEITDGGPFIYDFSWYEVDDEGYISQIDRREFISSDEFKGEPTGVYPIGDSVILSTYTKSTSTEHGICTLYKIGLNSDDSIEWTELSTINPSTMGIDCTIATLIGKNGTTLFDINNLNIVKINNEYICLLKITNKYNGMIYDRSSWVIGKSTDLISWEYKLLSNNINTYSRGFTLLPLNDGYLFEKHTYDRDYLYYYSSYESAPEEVIIENDNDIFYSLSDVRFDKYTNILYIRTNQIATILHLTKTGNTYSISRAYNLGTYMENIDHYDIVNGYIITSDFSLGFYDKSTNTVYGPYVRKKFEWDYDNLKLGSIYAFNEKYLICCDLNHYTNYIYDDDLGNIHLNTYYIPTDISDTGYTVDPKIISDLNVKIQNTQIEYVQYINEAIETALQPTIHEETGYKYIDLFSNNGNIQVFEATEDAIIRPYNRSGLAYCEITLYITNAGNFNVVLPDNVLLSDGFYPSFTKDGTDVLKFTTIDRGNTWFCQQIGQNIH